MADTIMMPLAQALLDCLCDQLALNPDPPAECCLRAGDFVIADIDGETGADKVCCPGLAYVRIGTAYNSTAFPAPDTRNEGCRSLARVVELTMGTVRCVPGMGDPAGPGCTDWTGVATHDANDLDAMYKALCCFADTTEYKRIKQRPFAAQVSSVVMQGGCIERVLPVLVQIPKCC